MMNILLYIAAVILLDVSGSLCLSSHFSMVQVLSFRRRPVPDLWCESVVLPTNLYPSISVGVSVWWVSASAKISGE